MTPNFGTQTTVSGTTAAVTTTAFSQASDMSGDWTNSDDAEFANFVLSCTFTTAPGANSAIYLYARLKEIDGSNHASVPAGSVPDVFIGAFLLANVTTAQYCPLANVQLPNIKADQKYEFYLQNLSAQTLPAGWALKITTKTY